MECSTPGFPVHHQIPEVTRIHVHWVSDAIKPLHPLSSPSPPPSVFPSIRVLSNESALHIRLPKYWSFSFNVSPSNGDNQIRKMKSSKDSDYIAYKYLLFSLKLWVLKFYWFTNDQKHVLHCHQFQILNRDEIISWEASFRKFVVGHPWCLRW